MCLRYEYACSLTFSHAHACTCRESVNIERSIETVNCSEPFIAVFGSIAATDDISIKVVVENINIITVTSVEEALHCCFACYYLFDISYPATATPLMLFLEQYFYKMKPSQKFPLSVKQIVDSLEKM